MRELNEILDRVEPRFGSRSRAYDWYRSEPLPGFNGQTAKQLVQAGKVAAVIAYIEAVDAGVHA
ncbi:antitoxin Xre/MbcA/ParS toxin-binding domain-containing protein [Aquibaculum arenosum]|uniref:antitoxin Xre/MbcA/ParS toxin-binding domain-containing protein n=1 Tax=Aquibaculum arenosum TaxID=3032591 RepID=UPI002AC33EEB|nr:antitoxin Xre/MbcA/ParS toxin-binding domain-containing protein [Fodinicurvata sp. CAU 1616]